MWLREARAMARLARDLPSFLRHPLGPDEAARRIRHRLETRGQRFLALAQRAIFSEPRSPYRRLLANAGCEAGDLGGLVEREGLEGALTGLARQGVYLTFDEFKGRSPVVRGSTRLEFAPADFDNPSATAHVETRTGGSRGRAVPVRVSLAFLDEQAASTAVMLAAHGLTGHETMLWLQGAFSGLGPALSFARLGRPPRAWFYPLPSVPAGGRLAIAWARALCRGLGQRVAAPRFNDLHDARTLAVHLARAAPTCVVTYASLAVRVANAARQSGLELAGTCFITMGEPFTAAKQRAVSAAGARAVPRYGFMEGGIVGYGCAAPSETDDMHLFADCLAVIPRRRETPVGSVDALLFTSLLSSAPKVLLNVETGDEGRLEARACGCGLGALGLSVHVSRVHSFEKLSGEGMSFVGIDLHRILEDVLPARLGGTGDDYQVVEEEDDDGILRTILLVSPRAGALDERHALDVFLEALGAADRGGRIGADLWRRAGTVQVRRGWPLATGAGKVLPFHVASTRVGPRHATRRGTS